ncbi:lipoyl synthase [Desulfogranum japonicum]|uniref:lipoyl synthase n=1 Tax=Desulfogranum japonicum TaxID=231447 RepID=UPI0004244BC9|nr:lipoyl synthase [Desulfogranum japonicum]
MTRPSRTGKPAWLKRRLPTGGSYEKIRKLVACSGLSTVCQEAMCPNQFECFGKGTATFMILGDHCTRDCRFCAVQHGPKGPPDPGEPERVAHAVATMQLHYAVITSVTRDDLPDGGAAHFAATIAAVRKAVPEVLIEVLIPDLQGDLKALKTVIDAAPDVLNHNMETVERLYPTVRPQAIYRRSLELLRNVKTIQPKMITKSGIMVGLGETVQELEQLFADLAAQQCDILTIGQYLQPSDTHLEVARFVPPEEFDELECKANAAGFAAVASAPFVRSSYQAETLYMQARQTGANFP